ncbi:Armadillo-type fold [Pseudocohnilembus persalinus]|uniref:Armadillo-type fold n=1 Tax=Pseudocohnilembus persalinus TaxID=266149 RepID=A0A0V0QJ06_PSEPJ|nr:Armadillo-type fold [Pseudocohnilembus persalinus]|eukprot:KRX02167.1 Armadillo-type fold [Pseudocohnilembus persalinus]
MEAENKKNEQLNQQHVKDDNESEEEEYINVNVRNKNVPLTLEILENMDEQCQQSIFQKQQVFDELYEKFTFERINLYKGCGTAKPAIAASFCHQFDKIVGIEYIKDIYDVLVNEVQKEYDQKFKIIKQQIELVDNIKYKKPEFNWLNKNYFDVDWSDADVLFVNSTCLDEDQMKQLAEKSYQMKQGAIFICTTYPFPAKKSQWKLLVEFGRMFYWGSVTIQRKEEIQQRKASFGDIDVNTYTDYLEVNVLDYDVTITPNFETKTITGEVIIDIDPLQDISRIYLDAWHLQVNSIKFATYDQLQGIDRVSVTLTEDQYEDNLDLEHEMGGYIDINLSGLVKYDGETNVVPKGQKFKLTIDYYTDEPEYGRESGYFFVDKEYTYGQTHPLLYTQNEPIYARTWFPCFDTPFQASTFTLTIILEKGFQAYATASLEREVFSGKNGEEWIFETQAQVSTFNVGFIVGYYEEKLISEEPLVIKLIAEEGLVEDFSEEIDDIKEWIDEIARILDVDFPYDGFQLVLMPPNYPHSGAQHGQLTYVSPTIMNSGTVGEQTIIHEISSVYFGNMVSCSTWENIWLNDGLATYIQRQGLLNKVGISYSKLDALVGNDQLDLNFDFIDRYNMDETLSSLHPNLQDKNPDNAYSQVSFEKGFQFMIFIEQQVMGGSYSKTLAFLNKLILDYEGKGISYIEFDEALEEYLIKQYGQADGEARYDKIDWDQWIFGKGKAPFDVISSLDNDKYDLAINMAKKFLQFSGTSLPSNYKDLLSSFDQIYIFLDYMIENIYQVDRRLIRCIEKYYNFGDYNDYMVLSKWYTLTTLARYNNDELKQRIQDFLGEIGRNHYIAPVYEAWREAYGQVSAGKVLEKHLAFYHPNTIDLIENIVFFSTM